MSHRLSLTSDFDSSVCQLQHHASQVHDDADEASAQTLPQIPAVAVVPAEPGSSETVEQKHQMVVEMESSEKDKESENNHEKKNENESTETVVPVEVNVSVSEPTETAVVTDTVTAPTVQVQVQSPPLPSEPEPTAAGVAAHDQGDQGDQDHDRCNSAEVAAAVSDVGMSDKPAVPAAATSMPEQKLGTAEARSVVGTCLPLDA